MAFNTNFHKGATKDQIRNVLNPFQYLVRVDDLAAPIIETHFTEYPQGLEQGPVGVPTPTEEPVRKTGTHQK